MTNKIIINKDDLCIINNIVDENELSQFKLTQDNSSGIGSLTNLEYECKINGRSATVTIAISTCEDW